MLVEWIKHSEVQLAFLKLFGIPLVIAFLSTYLRRLRHEKASNNEFPVDNKSFLMEPWFFPMARWAVRSREILDAAYAKFNGTVYRVARGDIEMVVVPSSFIPELNTLPEDIISSRHAHAYNLTGHLNGIDIVLQTTLHVKTLQHKLTPALPRLLEPMRYRIGQTIDKLYPQDKESWTAVAPMDHILHCISRATSLAAVGAPLCDDDEYVRLNSEHTKYVFIVMFVMRVIPVRLHSLLVWLVPAKWKLQSSLERLQRYIEPEVKKRATQENLPGNGDMLSWMMNKARDEHESDPYMLTRLLSALATGGTHSTANFTLNALLDLAAHPEFLEEVREEIREKHKEVHGIWDHAAFNGLHKLDSAMKESIRRNPGSLTAYNRIMMSDYTMSNGVTLKKGMMICVSACSKQMDPMVFEDPQSYNPMRAFTEDYNAHCNQPFRAVDSVELRWGTGRWACPGRFLASLEAKLILVKLIDEFDFKFPDDKGRPESLTCHEFIFARPNAQVWMKKRKINSGIAY